MTPVLPILLVACIRLRNPERKEKKKAPFLRAIKQSVEKSVRQHSAVIERGTGRKVPTA